MSLSLKDHSKKNKPIAYLLKNGQVVDRIYYVDEDDMPEGEKKLKIIKLKDKEQSLFPFIKTFEGEEQNERLYICGESGCGKTYNMIRKYAELFHQKYPQSRVLIFTSKLKDKAIDDLRYIERVQINEDILENPLSVSKLAKLSKPLLTIFDDIEDFPNKKITKEIERLRNEIMRNGRSSGIYILYTHHDPCDYIHTKAQIFESTAICTFPRQSGDGAYDYLYKNKLHLDDKTQKIIKKQKSKFVFINKKIPKYILTDKFIMLL